METTSFVYKWTQQSTGKWYIGYHKGQDHDGYICSSETVKPMIQADPHDWTREILNRGNKADMIKREHELLSAANARANEQSYNLTNGGHNINRLSLKDMLGYDLNTMSEVQVAEKYSEEISCGDPERRIRIEKWIARKVFNV